MTSLEQLLQNVETFEWIGERPSFNELRLHVIDTRYPCTKYIVHNVVTQDGLLDVLHVSENARVYLNERHVPGLTWIPIFGLMFYTWRVEYPENCPTDAVAYTFFPDTRVEMFKSEFTTGPIHYKNGILQF